MSRQHATPLLLTGDAAKPLRPLDLAGGADAMSEAAIQALIFDHPGCLPIGEIDPSFVDPVPICTELGTLAGPIDVFMVTPAGLPVLVECKLWRNPEARREVVGQILDYAKELSRWSSSDLQREVSKRLKRSGNALLDLIRTAGHEVDEIGFNDALTSNLRRGRFLLLIVGDGIREGVEAIAEYLQAHAGLHFGLGLVELPIYAAPDGSRLVAPRILARTHLIGREAIAFPPGLTLTHDGNELDASGMLDGDAVLRGEGRARRRAARLAFWNEFLDGLELDDPEQPIPVPARSGPLAFMQPAPAGSCWLTVYRDARLNQVGVSLSYSRGYAGERAVQAIVDDWQNVHRELGAAAVLSERKGKHFINEHLTVGDLDDADDRTRAFKWLRERVNIWVNVLRPRIRAAIADLRET